MKIILSFVLVLFFLTNCNYLQAADQATETSTTPDTTNANEKNPSAEENNNKDTYNPNNSDDVYSSEEVISDNSFIKMFSHPIKILDTIPKYAHQNYYYGGVAFNYGTLDAQSIYLSEGTGYADYKTSGGIKPSFSFDIGYGMSAQRLRMGFTIDDHDYWANNVNGKVVGGDNYLYAAKNFFAFLFYAEKDFVTITLFKSAPLQTYATVAFGFSASSLTAKGEMLPPTYAYEYRIGMYQNITKYIDFDYGFKWFFSPGILINDASAGAYARYELNSFSLYFKIKYKLTDRDIVPETLLR